MTISHPEMIQHHSCAENIIIHGHQMRKTRIYCYSSFFFVDVHTVFFHDGFPVCPLTCPVFGQLLNLKEQGRKWFHLLSRLIFLIHKFLEKEQHFFSNYWMENSFTSCSAGIFLITVHFCGNKKNQVKTVLPPSEAGLIQWRLIPQMTYDHAN